MIELKKYRLMFSFPEVYSGARLNIDFQRTLRIPDDGRDYPLPPGLGRFPLRHVDDHPAAVPAAWVEHGGVMLPMYQSEALWLNFQTEYLPRHQADYPCAVKVAAGKINAVTGNDWDNVLQARPQDYLVAPRQPWLDGYCVEKGIIRQFVAMPLGAGYSAEEQLTAEARHGGIQIVVYPMKREVFLKRFPERRARAVPAARAKMAFSLDMMTSELAEPDMGLAPGGRMRQEIFDDPFDIDDWDTQQASRCFVHLANSMVWRAITGQAPPTVPFTAKEYNQHKLPWFESYDDGAGALKGSGKLKDLKSVVEMGKQKGDKPLPENQSVSPERIVELRKGLEKGQVREGRF